MDNQDTMRAVVRFTRAGWHRWPEAPASRAYLASSHRHLFSVEVHVEVFHDEREVEYHDLLAVCTMHFPGGDMGAASCETMARHLAKKIADAYPRRWIRVSVFEDNEVGAIYSSSLTTEGR